MKAGTRKLSLVSFVACCVFVLNAATARADLSASQARKALTRIPGFELNSSAVRVNSVSAAGEASADVKVVFRFEADKEGRWRVAEIRTGQERWEYIDALAAAINTRVSQGDCAAPDAFARGNVAGDLSVKRARCLIASLLGVELPSDAVRIQSVDPMPIPIASQPSATVVAWVRVEARLLNDKGGWRVSELRTGNRDWVRLDQLSASLDEEKQKQANAELQLIAKALDKFRVERGFYIVSDKYGVAIDHLSPRYLARVIRLDPWHRPYKYQGQPNQFSLRSLGPDGKENTPDDLSINGASSDRSPVVSGQ